MSASGGSPLSVGRALSSGWPAAGTLAVVLVAVLHQGTLISVRRRAPDEVSTLAEVRDHIVNRWVDEPNRDKLRYGAVEGMVATLDPYSEFISPERKERFDEETQGEFGGIGVFIDIERGTGKVVVISPLEDTPAWRAGILPGDKFLEIEGETYELASAADAQRKLRGKPGSKVKLLVQTEGKEPRLLELERAVIKVKSVKGGRIVDAEDSVGYLRITQFQEPTRDEFDRVVADLKAASMKALVLDLRGNPGGLLRTSTELAARFLKKDSIIVVTKGRNQDPVKTPAEIVDPPLLDLPVAILLDGGSASASEILAGALRDNGRATLVGTRSFGKGSVQNVIAVEGGRAELKLTTQYYFTPSGRRIHRREGAKETDEWGLLPDIQVALDPNVRQELLRKESEDELAALKQKAQGGSSLGASSRDPRDAQLGAAVLHLKDVLHGKAKLAVHVPGTTAPVSTQAPPPGVIAGPRKDG
jgi:carboxyl-terminal processing protease